MTNAYDSVRYPGNPFPQADPAVLGVFAKLLGLPFAPFESCRYLEIGCGDGVNLINLAQSAPQGRFVGVDLAEAPIESAKADAAACGLSNVEFFAADLRDIGAAFGEFDYIIAHGVLAWVPDFVRAALFRVIGERLAPGGLAMVSFAALPGARASMAIRDMLAFETRDAPSPQEKVHRAVAALEAHLKLWSDRDVDGAQMIATARRILSRTPATIYHDELSEAYAPQLLSDVAAAAAAHGLAYLADVRPQVLAEAFFPSQAGDYAREKSGGDWTRFQQYRDFQEVCSFHNAIFVKGGEPDYRRVASRLEGLFVQGELREVAPDPEKPDLPVFVAGGRVKLSTNDPRLAALFRALGDAYPQAVPIGGPDLPAVADHVFRLFTSQLARFSTAPPRLVREPGERPFATPFARLQAARGESQLATLMQTLAAFEEAPLKLLVLLDGSHDREALAQHWAASQNVELAQARADVTEALAVLGQAGVMSA